MIPGLRLPSPVVELEAFRAAGVRLWVKRDDLMHPEVPGNKWRKLKYNLAAAREQGVKQLLTFGGAYSNHLRAVAAAGHLCGFETIGVVRGDEHLPLNDSLAFAVERGMRLTYLDRTTYRRKTGLRPGQQAVGFSALKGGSFLAEDVARLQRATGEPTGNWRIETEFHFGGFAKRIAAPWTSVGYALP
ncbi:1-aminocyclopropane-1-carboxylate deaminase/D-cysteine desulfhydrase [Labedaea rhizosphaerae]|uniref:1-aminocyclopropane-1-carboxylate deaminase/D-cysteine desulfhydrase n=1 Tax=Labedaea rhizosphaerae TaxID=598644 RepID=UPI00105D4B4E|nr:pyridoxal-phosphate dependent enzyme [Labedaea rhizosphaerae]